MEHEAKDLTEKRILERINLLESQQIVEVLDFIEFLAARKRRETPLIQFLNETTGPAL